MRNGLSSDLIARILGAAPKYTVNDLEEKYPVRNLPTGAIVSRFAPSPTGYYHMGNLYQNIISENLAHCPREDQPRGVFYLRIEDTDTKREVDGATDIVVSAMAKLGFKIDEGMVGENKEIGEYGPYSQSARRDIYHSVVAELLEQGKAYPCFLTAPEMDEIRKEQTSAGMPTGIYGEWARYRDSTKEEIIKHLDNGEMPSIRLYSNGDPSRKIFCKEGIRGSVDFPENNEDSVLIKSNDGLPTYHFAHLVDDHFMRTTHVTRGVEWLPSLPLHIQLFNLMGWTPPVYIHHATIDTLDKDTGNRRKLSKRKDRFASFDNLWSDGWPPESFLEYVFNLIASGYEESKIKNPLLSVWNYPIKIKKLSSSGALFDIKKLEWWAREHIATLSAPQLSEYVINWAGEYSHEWSARINKNPDYLGNILSIERVLGSKRNRKDFYNWSQTMSEIEYFFDDKFISNTDFDYNKNVLDAFQSGFDINDDRDTWWGKILNIALGLDIKPGDIAMNLRVAITGRMNTPDLYSVIRVMSDNDNTRIEKRIADAIKIAENQGI